MSPREVQGRPESELFECYDIRRAEYVRVIRVRYADGAKSRCEWRRRKYPRDRWWVEDSFEIDPIPARDL